MQLFIHLSRAPALLPSVQRKFSFSPTVQCRPKVQFEQWPGSGLLADKWWIITHPGQQTSANQRRGSLLSDQSEASVCQHNDMMTGRWFSTNIGATELFYSLENPKLSFSQFLWRSKKTYFVGLGKRVFSRPNKRCAGSQVTNEGQVLTDTVSVTSGDNGG